MYSIADSVVLIGDAEIIHVKKINSVANSAYLNNRKRIVTKNKMYEQLVGYLVDMYKSSK